MSPALPPLLLCHDDGIVVVEVEKGERVMVDLEAVPVSLRERLGPEGSAGLVQVFNRAQKEWSAEVLNVAAERFERRLVEETSKLRVEMAQGFAAVRQEMAQEFAAVRGEMAQGLAAVRGEMAQGFAAVRGEMAQGLAAVRQDMAHDRATLRQELAAHRAEQIKWAFGFWLGQVAVTLGFVAFMLRGLK